METIIVALICVLVLPAILLFTAYCAGAAYHWAPGDPQPSVQGFIRDLLELIFHRA